RLLRRGPGLREPERGLVPQRLLSDPSVRRELRHSSELLAALEPDARRSTEIRRLPLTPRRLLLSSERRALRGGLALDGSRVALRLAHCRRAPAEPATRARQRELAGHRLVGRELQLRLRRARPLGGLESSQAPGEPLGAANGTLRRAEVGLHVRAGQRPGG